MQSRKNSNFFFGQGFDFNQDNVFTQNLPDVIPPTPLIGNFLLLDGTPFKLLDGTNLLLL